MVSKTARALEVLLVTLLTAACGGAAALLGGGPPPGPPPPPSGDLYVATLLDGSVYHFNAASGQLPRTVVRLGATAVGGIDVNRIDCNLYVSFQGVIGGGVSTFNGASDALIGVFVPADPTRNGGLLGTGPITFGSDGTLYVAHGPLLFRYQGGTGNFLSPALPLPTPALFITFANGIIYMSVPGAPGPGVLSLNVQTGAVSHFIDMPLHVPGGITFGSDGSFYAVQTVLGQPNLSDIFRFTSAGAPLGAFVAQGTSGGLGEASDLAFGPDGNLYVLSLAGNKVFRFSGTDGRFIDIPFAIPGPLGEPTYLAWSPCRR